MGRLDPTAQSEVEVHLTTCVPCQHSLALARRLTAVRHQPAKPSSAGVMRRAVAAFRRHQQQVAQRAQRVATLQFDNLTQAAASGTRGGPKARQLLYTFDEFDLDLQVEEADHTLVLRGQLLPHTLLPTGLEGIMVRLAGTGPNSSLRLTDELGCFCISGLLPGLYALHVVLEDRNVAIDPLVLPG